MLENLRGSRNDMDFMVADFENGDNAKDILAQSDKAVSYTHLRCRQTNPQNY